MSQLEKDLLVQSRFRNAKLWELLAGRTVSEVSELTGVSHTTFGLLLNLRTPPVRKDGTFTLAAQKIADHFRMLPEDLFPATLYALVLPKSWERTFSSEVIMLSLESREALALEGDSPNEVVDHKQLSEMVETVLGTLTPREQEVIRKRFGLNGEQEMSLSATGESMTGARSGKPISQERVRQMEAKALRKLRHPERSRLLRGFMDDVRD